MIIFRPAKITPKPDPIVLKEIDDRLANSATSWRLEEGVKYWRWACIAGSFDDNTLRAMIINHGACGGYSGIMLGKPLTALFFYPAFE